MPVGDGVPPLFGTGGGNSASNSSRDKVSTSSSLWAMHPTFHDTQARIFLAFSYASLTRISELPYRFAPQPLLNNLAARRFHVQEDQLFLLAVHHRTQVTAHA